MINHKAFIVYLIVLLTNYVNCDEDDAEEVKRRSLFRASQNYRFNHPPFAENYATIPVSIVYDKVVDRTNRKNKVINPVTTTNPTVSYKLNQKDFDETKVPQDLKDNKDLTPTLSDSIETTTEIKNESTVFSVNPTEKDFDDIKIPESKHIKLEYKIPVSVVYDEEPVIVKYTLTTRTRQRPIKRRRKPTSKPKNKSKSEEKLLKNVTEQTTTTQSTKIGSDLESIGTRNGSKKLNQDSNTNDKINASKYNENKRKQVNSETNNLKRPTGNDPEKKRQNGEPDPIVPIVTSENRVYSQNGEFQYSYEGGDGTIAFSKGQLKTFDDDVKGEAVEGGFSYKDKDGNDFSLTYTADENGYRPVGAHLPTSPPIPPAIARALEYLATKTTPESFTESLDDY